MAPRKKKEETSPVSGTVAPVLPPIENDIFAEDVKWLINNKNGVDTDGSTPIHVKNREPMTAAYIETQNTNVSNQPASASDYTQQEYTTITQPYTVPYTVPNTNPGPNTMPYNPVMPTPTFPSPSFPSPIIPSVPSVPSAPSIPSIPDYNLNNIMNNQTNNSAQIFMNETSLWSVEWTIPNIYSLDASGNEIASYKDVVCSIRTYANDTYGQNEIAEASKWVFAMVHTVMDAVRKHSDQIHPDGGIDYLETIDPTILDMLTSFRKRMLNKRLGYPRITVKCRYGFKMPGSNVDVKVEAYEHTDPLDCYAGIMKYLETMRRIELIHKSISEKVIDQRKQTFNQNNGQQSSYQQAPAQSQAPTQQRQQAPAYQQNNGGQRPQSPPPKSNNGNIINDNQNGTGEIINCRYDEDAQNAPYGSTIAYHAVRVFRKDQKFNFYMDAESKGRPRGIYAYETGRGASPVIEQALKDGRLPPLQNDEATDYEVTIIALKLQTQNGYARYDVKDIIRKQPFQ